MHFFRKIALISIFATTSLAHAAPEPFTCSELHTFVFGVATARDKGEPLDRAIAIVMDEPGFSRSDKVAFKKVVERIYENRSVRPDALADLATIECIRTGKRKP